MSDVKSRAFQKGWALALLATMQFMLILDSSIVNVALPSIQGHFHVHTESTLSWAIDGYVLTFGGWLLLGGRLGDRLGRRNMFFAGTALFGAAFSNFSIVLLRTDSSTTLVGATVPGFEAGMHVQNDRYAQSKENGK